MSLGSILKRTFTWWNGQTFGTQLFTWRKGEKVGEDKQGNIFYRNADDSKRWVIFNGEIEASRIDPEWHGGLHRTWDEPPTTRPMVHRPWEKAHEPNHTGTAQAYAPAGSIRRAAPVATKDYDAWQPE